VSELRAEGHWRISTYEVPARGSVGDTVEVPEDLAWRLKSYVSPPGPRCAECLSDAVHCVSCLDESGTGWRQYLLEFACRACSKVTLFHWDD
jgi:hypothetical protein